MFEKQYAKWLEIMKKLPEDSPLKPSPPDPRDYVLSMAVPMATNVNKAELPPPPFHFDQLTEPECVGAGINGAANALYNALGIMPEGGFSPSFLYKLCKMEDGIPNEPGTYIRVGLKVAQKVGLCPEKLCPSFRGVDKTVITDEMRKEAAKYKIKAYYQVHSLQEIKNAIANGMYIIIGTMVTEDNWIKNIEANKGHLGKPRGFVKGGHCTYLRSFDDLYKYADLTGYERGENSWGEEWGDKGGFYMPYDYHSWSMSLDFPEWLTFMEAWAVDFGIPAPVKVDEKPFISIWIGKKKALVDGEEVEMNAAPIISESRTMVPLKFINQQLGLHTEWDSEDQRVDIYKKGW